MDVLVVGVSRIATRRLIPALLACNDVERIHLASRRASVDVAIPDDRRGRFFSGYQEALDTLEPGLAYVSLPNALHAEWARRALTAGFHVAVDKPAFQSLSSAAELLEAAAARGLCLAEATVWPFHPQVELARQAFADTPGGPTAIQAAFSFPPLPAADFRNDPSRGGGALNDLGPYAVSAGRVFFGDAPEEISCRAVGRDPVTGIDTGFALTAVHAGGRVLQGFFSFRTEYVNRVVLLGSGTAVTLDPAFTSPGAGHHDVVVRRSNVTEVHPAPAGDSFGEFVSRLVGSIGREAWSHWPRDLWQDAVWLDRAFRDAGVERHAD